MNKSWHWPNVRTAATLAAIIAVVGFFLLSPYPTDRGVIVNVMQGRTFAGIPFHWVLAALAAFVGISALKHRKP